MKPELLRIGIIGCGGMGRRHAEGWQKSGIRVSAIADIDLDAAKRLAEICNGAKIFTDVESLLDTGDVDAVSICTPPVAHEEACVYALKKGVHVLCEKPLAHTVESGLRIKAAAEETNAVCMVAFRHRFLPAICRIKQMIDDGAIGDPVFFHNRFCGPAFEMKDKWFTRKKIAGGGCMLDTSSHSVDLFRYLIGEVKEQCALTHQHFVNTDVEDAAILSLKAENGTLGSLTSGFVSSDGVAFIDITGQDGRLLYEYYNEPDKLRYRKRGETDWEIIVVEPSNGFAEQIVHFKAVMEGRETLLVGVEDGLRCLEIICANYQGVYL